MDTPSPMTKDGGYGPMVGTIVIIALIAVGGFLYLTNSVSAPTETTLDGDAMSAQDVAALEMQGSSVALTDIEADLEATDVSGLDEASADFESELNTQ